MPLSHDKLLASNNNFNNVGPFNFGDNATVPDNHPGQLELVAHAMLTLYTLSVAANVPPRHFSGAPIDLLGDGFTGRLREFFFLSELFDEQNVSTEEDVPTRCVVYGMPGVGKTNWCCDSP
jgi:hypothetical protein